MSTQTISLSTTHSTASVITNDFENEDIIYNIFKCFVPDIKELARLSLVNRLWHRVASRPTFWQPICIQTGIAIPFDVNRSRNAYNYEAKSLLREKVKACQVPSVQIVNSPVNLSEKCVHFVQDAYFIVQDEYTVTICDLNTGQIVQSISTSQKILSVCTSQKKVYLSLTDRLIQGYDLLGQTQEPILVLDGHKDDDILNDHYPNFMIQLFANDQWLISCSSKTIKQWNSTTGCCVSSIPAVNVHSLQINQNTLYQVHYGRHLAELSCIKLDDCDLTRLTTISLQQTHLRHSDVHIDGNNCSFIVRVTPEPAVNLAEDSESDTELIDLDYITVLNLSSDKQSAILILEDAFYSKPYLKTVDKLAIMALAGRCSDEINGDSDPDTIQLFDLESGKLLHRIEESYIHLFNNQWSIATFHDTILYATQENQIVKITFQNMDTLLKKVRFF
jgi:WD40 repeat protein